MKRQVPTSQLSVGSEFSFSPTGQDYKVFKISGITITWYDPAFSNDKHSTTTATVYVW